MVFGCVIHYDQLDSFISNSIEICRNSRGGGILLCGLVNENKAMDSGEAQILMGQKKIRGWEGTVFSRYRRVDTVQTCNVFSSLTTLANRRWYLKTIET